MRRLPLTSVLVLATWPGPAAAAVERCGSIAITPHTEDGIFDIRAQATSCVVARRVARRAGRFGVTAEQGPLRYHRHGFTCTGRAIDEGLPTVFWRCRAPGRSVSFSRS